MARHRVLVVGVGSIGERHLRCFGNTGRADLSLCEVNESLRNDVARRYGVARCFAHLEEALADPPTAAVVATPAPLHVPQATRLAEAGVHVLIEKPLSVSLDGVERLREVSAGRRLTVGVAYVLRFFEPLPAMRRAIADGRFGRPVQ